MKKAITIVSLSLLAATAFAGGYGGGKPGQGGNTPSGPAIDIDGTTVQVTSMSYSAVKNEAYSGSTARQNISSNTGNITINSDLTQMTTGKYAYVSNQATGGAVATQNLASNIGKVDVNDKLTQVVAMKGSAFVNVAADKGSSAVQNVSSNNGCQSCQ